MCEKNKNFQGTVKIQTFFAKTLLSFTVKPSFAYHFKAKEYHCNRFLLPFFSTRPNKNVPFDFNI